MFYYCFFRRTALYGIISLLISLFILKKDFSIIYATTENETFVGLFCLFMICSIIAYPILMIVDGLLTYIASIIRWGKDEDNSLLVTIFGPIPNDILLPITNTIDIIQILGEKDEISFGSWVQLIIGLIWTIILVPFIGIGLFFVYHL